MNPALTILVQADIGLSSSAAPKPKNQSEASSSAKLANVRGKLEPIAIAADVCCTLNHKPAMMAA